MNVGFGALLATAATDSPAETAPLNRRLADAGETQYRGVGDETAATPFAALLLAFLGETDVEPPVRVDGSARGDQGDERARGAGAAPFSVQPTESGWDELAAGSSRPVAPTECGAKIGVHTPAETPGPIAAGDPPTSEVETPRGTAGVVALPPDGQGSREGAVAEEVRQRRAPAPANVADTRVAGLHVGEPAPIPAPEARWVLPPRVAADVKVADRSFERLHPELRTRVKRVMERMRQEHGLSVTLIEGYRTPERQGFLYAQGRSSPGPVVTWTRDSLHTRGLAADLKVEGPWHQPEAYRHLWRIAREEGLETLGARDPGHVELRGREYAPGSPPAEDRAEEGRRGESGNLWVDLPPRSSEGTARVAPVARVARVAEAAPAAQVSSRPIRLAPADFPSHRASRVQTNPISAGDVAPAAQDQGDLTDPVSVPSGSTTPAHDGRGSPMSAPGAADPRAVGAELAGNVAGGSLPRAPGAPQPSARSDITVGVERVQEVREALAALPIQRVTLRMEGGQGAVQRIRVDLAERVLKGQVEVADTSLASRLRADGHTLVRALEARGFEAPEVTVGGSGVAGKEDAVAHLLASLRRGEAAPPALKVLFGEAPTSPGRVVQDAGFRQSSERSAGQDEFQQGSRREYRREAR